MTKDLNSLSADVIMGWTDIGEVYTWERPGTIDDAILKIDWSPLTDLNQCFMVVEKMKDNGWWLFLDNELNEATFFNRLGGIVSSRNTDMAQAILTAALNVEGVEVE